MHEIALLIEPDEDDPGCATVLVDGSLDGHPRRFLLDTGAARTCVRYDEVTAGLPLLGESRSSALFTAQRQDVVSVGEVSVGSKTWSGRLPVTREGQPAQWYDILGMDLLGTCCCDFDFAGKRLVLDRPDREIAVNPLTTDAAGHPYVAVRQRDVTAAAVWDSGASITVVDEAFVSAHPDHFTEVPATTGTDAAGERQETTTFRMGAVQVGGHELRPSAVAAVDLARVNADVDVPMDMIVGYPLLAQARWIFDFPARRWGLTPI